MTKIVFDIGGTSMRVAPEKDGGLGEVVKVATPRDPHEAIATLTSLMQKSAGASISAVAGGIRGRVIDGVFQEDKVLSEWYGLNIVDEISKALGASVKIVHDTAAAGLGETHHGAGRGSNICAYITVSTGVGGDRIVDGRIDRATYNPEIGRQLIDGVELEDLVSGTAVQKKFGMHPQDLESEEERNKLADLLAIGLYNTTLHWSPDTIVLGGSMILGKNSIPLPRVVASLAQRLATTYPTVPVIKKAELGDSAGLYGALVMLLENKQI